MLSPRYRFENFLLLVCLLLIEFLFLDYLNAKVAGRTLPYDTLEGVRARMLDVSPALGHVGAAEAANFTSVVTKLAAGVKLSGE